MQSAEYLTEISPKLRTILKDIEKYFDISFENIDQIFKDMDTDQVGENVYQLNTKDKLQILGRVDEYEPETIWLTFIGLKRSDKKFLYELLEVHPR